MQKKVSYKIRNWSKYNQSLINRGNLTIWFNERAIEKWYSSENKTPTRGRPFIYSDSCIELALTIRSLFHIPLRATQGFLKGLVYSKSSTWHILPYWSFVVSLNSQGV